MELNLYEAIRNNIEGLLNVIDISKRFLVTKFLFISSDKAVYPTSVMGLTNRAGELVIEKENQISKRIQFLSLRFKPFKF
ncbi:MAG: polysaccharide biosynthesis protein [Polaribacter sp.]|nr:polysaccharide biosynthesis protein [Polaribacter sp.]